MELCFNVRTFFSTVYPFRSFLNRLIAANFLIRSIIRIGTRKWRLFCAPREFESPLSFAYRQKAE